MTPPSVQIVGKNVLVVLGLKIFKTLRRSNSREFLKHGTNLVFIRESKYISFIWVNSILREKLNLNFY